ncbi:MAG: hypothetical protein GYB38_11280 [Gammaproteobacteria bacterium]|nr:hypothetical protein [Gammaproteobacteria bacterium]
MDDDLTQMTDFYPHSAYSGRRCFAIMLLSAMDLDAQPTAWLLHPPDSF